MRGRRRLRDSAFLRAQQREDPSACFLAVARRVRALLVNGGKVGPRVVAVACKVDPQSGLQGVPVCLEADKESFESNGKHFAEAL